MPSAVPSDDQSMADPVPQQQVPNDEEMPDQEADDIQQQEEAEDENARAFEYDQQRITVLPGAIENAASFQFEGEDHTLGNALRYTIMKNPEVEFCGYTIPHPSEPKMNVRIQTYDSTNVFEALEKGLNDLIDLCDVVTDKFTTARDGFEESKMQ